MYVPKGERSIAEEEWVTIGILMEIHLLTEIKSKLDKIIEAIQTVKACHLIKM